MATQTLAQMDPEGLEAYFTDVEHLREVFNTLIAAPTLSKRLLIIHGVGGVGKSSLLRMFRLHCKRESLPVGLASGDEAKSAVEVLIGWANDLKVAGVKLPTFTKTVDHYRAIQAKVEEQVRKAQEIRDNTAGTLGKAAAKTVVETAVSAIPIVGPLISGLSGMGAEVLVDWLGSFLKKPDIDLLLDPIKALTDDFLTDVAAVVPKQRLVLMLDTFEQMATLEEWVRDLAQRLHPNLLLVVAGRAVPNWSRQWPGWLAQAEVQELKPMTDAIMRELVSRYYATMRGGEPDPAQVEAILTFARGLPIVVTSAVRLWVQYGVEDFQAVKPQVVADLVDRLLEGVPRELVPILEAAAVVRWFNKDILRALTSEKDINTAYDELRRFPFTRPRTQGFAFHDAVREIMDENLRIQDPMRYNELHERALAYFETRLPQASSTEAERFALERLYHLIKSWEAKGIRLFQEMAEELVRSRMINQLRALLGDVSSHRLEQKNSQLWREYYMARLANLEARTNDAQKIYEAISMDESIELRLRAYTLCDLGSLLSRYERSMQPGGLEKAVSLLEQSLGLAPLDSHLAYSLFYLARIRRYQTRWTEAATFLKKAKRFFEECGDGYGLSRIYLEMLSGFATRGLWKDMFTVQEQLESLYHQFSDSIAMKSQILSIWNWGWALVGRLAECEHRAEEGIKLARSMDDLVSLPSPLRDLGWALGYQGRYIEAGQSFTESLEIAERLGKDYSFHKTTGLMFWAAVLIRQGEISKATDYLSQSLKLKEKLGDAQGILRSFIWMGNLYEVRQDFGSASESYNHCLTLKYHGFNYPYSQSLTGLIRVKHAQADYTAIPLLLTEVEQIAQQYEYNDHLASLRLTQGHIAWDGHFPEWSSGFEAALHYYQHALIHALRYNRFLLDEVLWGGGICTPLQPIIPRCQERGNEGRQMLTALRDWWQAGANDIGVARPDTISPISEGIPLLEAERLARQREPGDGSPQLTVLKQIESALN